MPQQMMAGMTPGMEGVSNIRYSQTPLLGEEQKKGEGEQEEPKPGEEEQTIDGQKEVESEDMKQKKEMEAENNEKK